MTEAEQPVGHALDTSRAGCLAIDYSYVWRGNREYDMPHCA